MPQRDSTTQSPGSPPIAVAVFGKHQGWNDHIDDLGLETQALIQVKRFLYTEGIGRNIDSGAWDSLDESKRIEGFKHVFVWRAGGMGGGGAAGGGGVVVGRLWSSSDGKGRKKYPMVICAHGQGVALDWLLSEAMPQLESLEQACIGTTSADEVRQAADLARNRLRERLLDSGPRASRTGFSINPLQRLLGCQEMGEDKQGLLRIMYQIERDMGAFGRVTSKTSSSLWSKAEAPRPQHVRVPACANSPSESALLWLAFLMSRLHEAAPMLVMAPMQSDGSVREWVDLVVGEPEHAQIFCMRASLKNVPLATEVPYTFDQDFTERASKTFAAAANGHGVSFDAASVAPTITTQPGLLRRLTAILPRLPSTALAIPMWWCFAAVVLAAIATAAILFLSGEHPQAATSDGAMAAASQVPARAPGRVADPASATVAAPGQRQAREPQARPASSTPPALNIAPPDDWRLYCIEYESWFAYFVSSVRQAPQVRQGTAKLPPSVASLLDLEPANPFEAAGVRGGLNQLIAHQPSAEVLAKARGGLAQVKQFRAEMEAWPPRQAAAAIATLCGSNGWPELGARLAALSADASPPPLDRIALAAHAADPARFINEFKAPELTALSDLVDLGPELEQCLHQWKRIESHREALASIDDEAMNGFAQALATHLRDAAPRAPAADHAQQLAALREQLAAAGDLSSQLAAMAPRVWRSGNAPWDSHQLDYDSFINSQWRRRFSTSEITFEDLRAWKAEFEKFPRLNPADDPRIAIAQSMQAIQARLAELSDLPADDPLRQQQRALQSEVGSSSSLASLPWSHRNEGEIRRDAQAIEERIRSIGNRIDDRVATRGSLAEYRAWLAGHDRFSPWSDAINGAWEAAREKALAAARDMDVRTEVEAVKRYLSALDDAEGLPPMLTPSRAPRSWNQAAAEKAWREQREQCIASALANPRWAGQTPDPRLPEFQQQWDAMRHSTVEWRDKGHRLIEIFADIESFCAQCRGLNQPDDRGVSIATLYSQAQTAFVEQVAIQAALSPLVQRVEQLARIESATDARRLAMELSRSLHAAPPEAVAATWRKLGELHADWPATLDELEIERSFRNRIMSEIGMNEAGAPDHPLANELTQQGQRRWEICIQQLSTAQEVERALEARSSFAIASIDDIASSEIQGAVLAYELRDAIAQTSSTLSLEVNRHIADLIADFEQAIQARGLAGFAPVIADLKSGVHRSRTQTPQWDPAVYGPGAAGSGWKLVSDSGRLETVTYQWGEHRLTFGLIEAVSSEGSAPAAYMSTSEVPVGFVLDWLNDGDRWSQAGDLFPSTQRELSRGVRVWSWVADRMALASMWPMGANVELRERLAEHNRAPSRMHPMQQIGPQVAVYVAASLNCRLPTSREWQSAYESARGDLAHDNFMQRERANLRDATWRAEVDAVNENAARTNRASIAWPGEGIFWPGDVPSNDPRRTREGATLPSSEYDDGLLWFDVVDTNSTQAVGPSPWRHLIGNVAEYVFDDPARLEALTQSRRTTGNEMVSIAESVVREGWAELGVIGGSALSDPTLDMRVKQSIRRITLQQPSADVGFRLAFTAGGSVRTFDLRNAAIQALEHHQPFGVGGVEK